ncbi:MAG: hypothetical protein ACLQU4_17090 [Limisphaerales bacterium]
MAVKTSIAALQVIVTQHVMKIRMEEKKDAKKLKKNLYIWGEFDDDVRGCLPEAQSKKS